MNSRIEMKVQPFIPDGVAHAISGKVPHECRAIVYVYCGLPDVVRRAHRPTAAHILAIFGSGSQFIPGNGVLHVL